VVALRFEKLSVRVLRAEEVSLPTEYAVPAAVLIARISCVKETILVIVDTCVDTMLLTPAILEPRTLRPVDAPVATPRAVEAVVEMPGMAAVAKAIPVIVETWVDTILLRPMKEPLRVEREVLVLLVSVRTLPATVLALYAVPRAVEAVVETPGIARVSNAIPLMVDT
jgi:hypothetical protein